MNRLIELDAYDMDKDVLEFNLGKVGRLSKNGMPLRKAWQRVYKKGSVADTPPANEIREMLANATKESTDGSVGRRILENRRPPASNPIRGTLGLSRGSFYSKPGLADILLEEKSRKRLKIGAAIAGTATAGYGIAKLHKHRGKIFKYLQGGLPRGKQNRKFKGKKGPQNKPDMSEPNPGRRKKPDTDQTL